jgi:hypothetical protein
MTVWTGVVSCWPGIVVGVVFVVVGIRVMDVVERKGGASYLGS